MRRTPTLVMCAVTGMVVVANLRAGALLQTTTDSVGAPPGVVQLAPAPAPSRGAATHRPAPRRTATAKPTTKHRSSPRPAPTAAAPRPTRAPATHKPAPTQAPAVVVNGAAVQTRYGPVQVQITISGHRITKARAIAQPDGSGTTRDINSWAIPQLDSETLNAQSAQIDTVSGATYTSRGYRSSLQSALDAAHNAGVW